MFGMSQQQYYGNGNGPPPRQYAGQDTSSAFSSSANPDEDWTKISDLAERRRIQNRIAQRNYRKKLKRRLEDLERRAGTSDDATSPKPPPTKSNKKPSGLKSNKAQTAQPPKQMLQHNQYTPPMNHDDEVLFQSDYDARNRSRTPPYMPDGYYPTPQEDVLFPRFPQQYRPMPTESSYAETFLAPVTLPPMNSHFNDAIKREGSFGGDESMVPYMHYNTYLPGIEPSPYDSNPHTPPLSHSFDHSGDCSDSGCEYPTTPLSMPRSPNMQED